ncbi:hypothetical protein D3C72_2213000 [compost metagenome]
MQRLPVNGGERGVARGYRGIAHVVIHFTWLIDRIAQFFQRAADDHGLERLFGNGALNRLNGNAFAREISRKRAG